MLKEFYADLEAAKPAEELVRKTLANLAPGYKFEDVSYETQCYYKGDIKAIAPDGTEIYLEVKDDSRIAETRNILCEEEVYFKWENYFAPGNMQSDYDYLCIVSKSEHRIYVLDFPKLKEIYKIKGDFKIIPHANQNTHCYLVPLFKARNSGALLHTINY